MKWRPVSGIRPTPHACSKKPPEAGFAPAQLRLAGMYEQGLGVDRDPTLAITLV